MAQQGRRARNAIVAMVLVAAIAAGAWVLLDHGNGHALPKGMAAATTNATAASQMRTADANRVTAAAKPAARVTYAYTMRPLPPPGTPLAQIYAELKTRADGGDAAAASRLFREMHRCMVAREQVVNGPTAATALAQVDTSQLSVEQLAEREEELANLQVFLERERKTSESCAGLDDNQMLMTPVVLEAARAGDLTASNCYVGGTLLFSDPKLLDHPEWLTEYRENALAIADAAVDMGDWGMVAQLQHSYAWDGLSMPGLRQLVKPDAAQNYRYLRLRRLGSGAESAPYYDRELAVAAVGLTAAVIAAGDSWAQATYARYFSANPKNTVAAFNLLPCLGPDESM